MNSLEKILLEYAPAEKLGRTFRLWRGVADRYLKPLGLTHPRWTALWKLARMDGEVSQKRLADALELELPSLMRTLGQLESQGLIERKTCETDRRARIVMMTEAGQLLLSEIEQRILLIRQSLLAGIPEDQLQLFEQLLMQISSNAEQMEQSI
ncbi:transcriptional regulator SlyA [Celerinatantimonas sp. YJH-8]|uniref:transcriptional regulator SlyA n=1 Tax=Celerinatantimonas sp. YJH-8 TaxID=3228714 RepID=UPI0038CB2AAA